MDDSETILLHVDDQDLPVRLTTHARARRLSLRVDPIKGCVMLIRPKRVSKARAVAFAMEKADWIAKSLEELLPPIPFMPGQAVPILDEPHTICHAPDARRGVWKEDGNLFVSGNTKHLSRRVRDWLREEARRTISPLAHSLAQHIGKPVSHISVRDTKSRWGSCSADGRLSFSWRLVMTPPFVLHYVVAHEVAHLNELNHSQRFWAIVESLTDDRKRAAQWLKREGAELYRYGLEP